MLNEKNQNSNNPDQWKKFVAGGAAAFAGRLCSQPLEVIKIQMQMMHYKKLKTDPSKLRRTLPFITNRIYKHEGVRGFFRGHNTGQILGVMQGAIQFCAYENVEHYCTHTGANISPGMLHFISGSISGALSVAVTNPLEVVKTRIISQRLDREKRNVWKIYQSVLFKEGFMTPFRGTMAGITQVAPLLGIKFAVYHQIIEKTVERSESKSKDHVSSWVHLFAGAASGIVANFLTYPMDVVRRKMQTTGFESKSYEQGKNFSDSCKRMISCMRLVKRETGLSGLFVGSLPSLIKSGLSTAVTFVTYEKINEMFKNFEVRKN